MPNNASAVLWRRLRYQLSPQLELYKNIVPLIDGKSVLEIGFGTGFGTLQYAARAKSVTALEYDTDAIDFAADVFSQFDIYWGYGDIASEGFYSTKHDVVLLVEVLEHVPDYSVAVRNIRNAVNDGGIVIITGPNANADLRKNDIHEREWTSQEFLSNLSKHFSWVSLFDYQLEEQPEDTRRTPLIAVCHA